MNDVVGKINGLVGGEAFYKLPADKRHSIYVVLASSKIVNPRLYTLGRTEFEKQYNFSKSDVWLSLIIALRSVFFAVLSSTVLFTAFDLLEHKQYIGWYFKIYASLIFLGLTVLYSQEALLRFLERKYLAGAASSQLRGLDVTPTARGREVASGHAPTTARELDLPICDTDQFLDWLAMQPRGQRLLELADRDFKGPADVIKLAKRRQEEFKATWSD